MMIAKRLKEGGMEVSSCKFLCQIRSGIILLKTDCCKWQIHTINPKAATKITQKRVIVSMSTKEIK